MIFTKQWPISKGHFTHESEDLWPLHFEHSRWWKRQSWSKFPSQYTWGDQGSKWMQDGCKIYMNSYMASIRSCFLVTRTILKFTLGDRPNKKHGTPKSHNHIFYHVWGLRRNINSFGWGPCHIWLHTTLEGPRSHHMLLKTFWDGLWIFWSLSEHLHPAALKGLGKPFDATLEKKLPHPISPKPPPLRAS